MTNWYRIDWLPIKEYYINNQHVPFRVIAEKFNVSEHSLWQLSARYGWAKEKRSQIEDGLGFNKKGGDK